MTVKVNSNHDFFYHTVIDFVASMLVNPTGDEVYEITYTPYPTSSLDQDPDKFDIAVVETTHNQMMYKFSINQREQKFSDILKQIVDEMTEGWD